MIRFAVEHYNLDMSESYSRVGKIVDRVGYKYIARTLILLAPNLAFKDANHFLNYIQKIATDLAIKETDG